MILGPQQSPYEGNGLASRGQSITIVYYLLAQNHVAEQFYLCLGGVFKLELFLPEDYPMAPPKVQLWSGVCVGSQADATNFLMGTFTWCFVGSVLDEDLPPQCGQVGAHLP